MPHARLTVADPDLSPALQQRLASTITDLLATDLLKNPEETVVHLELVQPGHFFVDGERQTEATGMLVEVYSTVGTITADEKSAFIAHAYDGVARALDPVAPIVYVVIGEVDGETWGFNGRSQLARRRSA